LSLLFVYLIRLLTTVPLLVGWKKANFSILGFFGFNFLSELINIALSFFKVNTKLGDTFHYNIILLITSVFLIYFYSNMYKIPKYWFFVLSFTYLLFLFSTSYYFFNTFFEFNTYAYSLLHFITLVFTTFGFYKIFQSQALVFIEKSAFFWLNSAFLIFASGSIIITIFCKYLIEHDEKLLNFFWTYLFGSVSLVFYSLSAYAFTLKDDEHFPIFRKR